MMIDAGANKIINILQSHGYKAYIVGGCVRDSLLGKEPKDWDICTNALPEQVEQIFTKTIPTGIKHGTITVLFDEVGYEITTFRKDGNYSDSRRPDNVDFTIELYEDLSRRDFTINAMAYNREEGLIDYFNSQEDLINKEIRTVGNPDNRFNEDALRMLRAVRFASVYNFYININTGGAICKNRNKIKYISQERIREELNKILLSDQPSYGITLLQATGLLNYILPELVETIDFDQHNPNHDKDIYEHTLSVLNNTPKDLVVRWAALLHDIGKPMTFTVDDEGIGHFYKHHIESGILAEKILKRLKFDNETIAKVCVLVKEHMSRYNFLRTSNIKKFINRVRIENLDNLFELQIADIKGSKPPHNFSEVLDLKEKVEKIINEKQPLTVKDLDINGYDLIKIGIKPGKHMGEILNSLLEQVLENPDLNKKEKLLAMI